MTKAKPLFPQSVKCPDCLKTCRVDWTKALPVPRYIKGVGVFNCIRCGTINTLTVGDIDSVDRYKQEIYIPGLLALGGNPETGEAISFSVDECDGIERWQLKRLDLKAISLP